MAQQSETLVGCNSLVSVAAQLPVTVAMSQMNRKVLGRISVGGFRSRGVKGSAGFVSPYPKGLARVAIVSQKTKDLTNDCR